MNAATLWLWDFPTHGVPSVKTDRSLAPFNNRETRPRKKNAQKRQMSSLKPCATPSPPTTRGQDCRFLLSQGWTRVCSYRAVLRGARRSFYSAATLHYLRRGQTHPLRARGGHTHTHNRLTNHPRTDLPRLTTLLPVACHLKWYIDYHE